ncbi:hypothetical protein H8356DRAFT_1063357 [Neocallimastix lanati (nom. inval.)]|uniref:Uncharacterized protein n=1 Tax=Neocallimastix californiae TaxID=1754190 RepID=A0A1Y1ZT06_9FUNG|nr:hypothetical protein H8356DRAFT_1063357 [Neocallimastix sp. JGI-2020a]ORY13340.1 hypothetical protein LY90DRAFT_518194 [Neocallimastix californiae]|eukprot:ORY13340.1 hypothetical protein LY90DRAFT_518194 [Neocallimastix californiae]
MEKSNPTTSYEKLIQDYILKQRRFKYLVKEIRRSIETCEYKKYGCSLNEFTKKNWNISQAQAYRYIIAAKVMDQLEEFEIQPNYVNLCKSLNNYAKTPKQLKLLWKTLLKKAGGKPYYINSSHVSKTWKEIFQNKKYSHICHYEEDVIKKIENRLPHNNITSSIPLSKTIPISPLVNPLNPPAMPVLPSTITSNISPLVKAVPLSAVPVISTPPTPNVSPLITPETSTGTVSTFVSTSTIPTTIFVPTPNSTLSISTPSFNNYNQLVSLNVPLQTTYYIQPLAENTLSQPYQIHQY